MENKKICACCKKENQYTDINERLEEMFEYAPDELGALEFFKLWRYPLEFCPDCLYVNKDIENNELLNDIINSDEYKNIFNNELFYEINTFEHCDADVYWAYALLNEKNGNFFDAGVGYLQAFYHITLGYNIYHNSLEEESEDSRIFTDCKEVAKKFLDNAESCFLQSIEHGTRSVHCKILLVYTYYELAKINKSHDLLKELSKEDLSTNQKAMVEYLTNLVEEDEY